jgi:indole-3-glycerol phosphate synthase
MSVLDEIFANKRSEVEEARRRVPLQTMRAAAEAAPVSPNFTAALRRVGDQRPRLIAEVKKASPSRGLLVENFNPTQLAGIYRENGASAISVLTDQRYFMGSLDYLRAVAALRPHLPVLRKDFIFDPYQVYEARSAGASAILLIAAMLEPGKLRELHDLAKDLRLSILIEVHNREELETALAVGTDLVGVNNRNLHDLKVSLETTFQLREFIPAHVCVVAESGIQTRAHVDRLALANVDAILVGEALVTAQDVAAKVRELAL